MKQNKQLVVNMFASVVTYVVTFGISFFISPYIVESVGTAAYGFIGLANNFISYASLISIALNSMAARFITIKIKQNDIEGANRYFSSVFFANSIVSIFLIIVFTILFFFLERIINIPSSIYWDVKILFALLFANCIIQQISSVSGVAAFATNKLYISSIGSIISQIIRVIILVLLFALCVPKVSYMGIATVVCSIYIFVYNVLFRRKLLPELHIKRKYFDFKAIKELLSSGVWNLITRLGQILQDGLDLLITNLFIDSASMGVLSISKTVPTAISGVIASVASVFSPNFTILYAEGKKEELVKSVKQSIKIMGVIVNIPIIVLMVCGEEFFRLWQPTQDARQLHILSLFACAGLIVVGGVNCIYNIFTVVNKIKLNSLLICTTGLLSVGTVFVILNTTDWGIFAVAGVSTLYATIRNIAFTLPYGAHCLGIKWYSLYLDAFKSVLFVGVSTGLCYLIKCILPFGGGWLSLVLMGIMTAVLSSMVGLFVILTKADRKYLLEKMKLKRKNHE